MSSITDFPAILDVYRAQRDVYTQHTVEDETAALEEHYNDPEVIPVTHMCPIPCDYYPRIWMNLFFVTLTSLLLMSIALCLYLTQQQLRMERRLKHR